MSTAFSTETIKQLAARLPTPQRLEIRAVLRLLRDVNLAGNACLDINLRSPVASRVLRMMGGYWISALATQKMCNMASSFLDEDVALIGDGGELPFEDKQFDVLILGYGCLSGDPLADGLILQECHRVMKIGGAIIFTVENKKKFGLARLLTGRRASRHLSGRYSENELFALLKHGFDVLKIHHYIRFWTQLARQRDDRRELQYGERDASLSTCGIMYAVAGFLDVFLFWRRGYVLTVCGRRKGWRERGLPKLGDGRTVSECVLHGYNR